MPPLQDKQPLLLLYDEQAQTVSRAECFLNTACMSVDAATYLALGNTIMASLVLISGCPGHHKQLAQSLLLDGITTQPMCQLAHQQLLAMAAPMAGSPLHQALAQWHSRFESCHGQQDFSVVM